MIRWTIGRNPNVNDITINAQGVSSEHACIKYYEGNRIVIEDLGSSNGVWLDNRRISQALVTLDDKIFLGETQFPIRRYFRTLDDHLLEPKDPNDFTDSFVQLEKIEAKYMEEKLRISKMPNKYFILMRLAIILQLVINIPLGAFLGKDSWYYILGSVLFFGLLSLFFFIKYMNTNTERERLMSSVLDHFKSQYICPNCEYSLIHDSINLIKMKDQYNCKACKVTIFKNRYR